MNSSAKFQLQPPYVFGGDDFLIFFCKFSISVAILLPWQPIKFSSLDNIHTFGRGLLQEHLLSKYL